MLPVGKGTWCIGLTNFPPSCAGRLELWKYRPPGTLWDCKRPVKGLLYFQRFSSDIPERCSAKHLQVLRKEIRKKNKINVTRSENCEFVRPWTVYRQVLVRNCLAPAACCEAVYTASFIDLSACHASAETALPARFLGTTRNIENVHTSCFFAPSISCVSIQSKVEKNQVAVQYYLFLSAFSACFWIEFFLYNYFRIFGFRTKHLPVAGFSSTYVVIQKISIFFQWFAGWSLDP